MTESIFLESREQFEERVTGRIRQVKLCPEEEIAACTFPVYAGERTVAFLRPITPAIFGSDGEIELLRRWREKANPHYLSQFEVTLEGTRRWLQYGLFDLPGRILFMVDLPGGRPVGHVGLYRFDFEERSCEMDNLIRGVEGVFPPVMRLAVAALHRFAYLDLQVEKTRCRIVSINRTFLWQAGRFGYREVRRVPLCRVERDNAVFWEECPPTPGREAERYFITLEMTARKWRERYGERAVPPDGGAGR
jgi:hypothetical protein